MELKIEKGTPYLKNQVIDFELLKPELEKVNRIIISEKISLSDFYYLLMLSVEYRFEVYAKPDFHDLFLTSCPVKIGNEVYSLYKFESLLEKSFSYKYVKRIIDVFVSLCGIVIFALILPVVAVLIKLESLKFPIFYTQKRLGLKGKEFKIIKFNTMFPDAEKNGPVWTKKEDVRVTKVGRFLRRFGIDEIPQFINVLKGDMSVVGPRPEREYFYNKYPVLRGLRLSVYPGITGYAQVNLREPVNEKNLKVKLSYDIFYIKNFSILLDFKIMYNTLKLLLRGRDF